MKSCIQCGTEATDDIAVCTSCGRQFSHVKDSEGQSPNLLASLRPASSRPDGGTAIAWSKGLGIVAALFLFISLCGGRGTIVPSTKLDVFFYTCLRLAGGLFWIALIIGLTGYVVRAISYLPGREDTNAQN